MVSRMPLRTLWRTDDGSALLAVLALLTVLVVLVGTVLAIHVAQYRFVRRDVHRLQARYVAEAGVYAALDSLQRDPFWSPSGAVLPLPRHETSTVTVEPFGAFLFVRAEARRRSSRYTVRALVGERPPAAFRYAVYLWDTESSLSVAGATRIGGDVVVGERGVTEEAYKGEPFTGKVAGTVQKTPGLAPPFLDARRIEQVVAQCEDWLRAAPDSGGRRGTPYQAARHLPRDNPVYAFGGDLHLTAADQHLLASPVTVVAAGTLKVEGPLQFLPGTVFAGGRVVVAGPVTGRGGLFFGRSRIDVEGGARLSAQLVSRGHIRLGGDAYLAYPSLLLVTGEGAEAGGAIEVLDRAVVDGAVLHPPLVPAPVLPRGRVVVGDSARVRGAVYNGLETELDGRVIGSLLTYRFHHYDPPTHYVNWLLDAEVDVSGRPARFALPVAFSPAPRLTVLGWEGEGEDVEAIP